MLARQLQRRILHIRPRYSICIQVELNVLCRFRKRRLGIGLDRRYLLVGLCVDDGPNRPIKFDGVTFLAHLAK